MTLILIPAAGASSRMRGADKLLEEVDGAPLLARQAARARATGCHVMVTLPPDKSARAAALHGAGVTLQTVENAAEGIAASLRAGAAAALAQGAAGLLVLLPDLPEITTDDINTVLQAIDETDDIIRATAADGTPGHPTWFAAHVLPEFATLSGDLGAAHIMKAHRVRLVALPGARATLDLDTPEAWAAWRALRR